jgi:hypothetical protein
MACDRRSRSEACPAVAFVLALAVAAPAAARTADQARSDTILWLARNQNRDGSWGSGRTKALVTAEAVLALDAAGAGEQVAVERALAWLRRQELAPVDYRARRVRALAAQGALDAKTEADALSALRNGNTGWGVEGPDAPNACDTALALGALAAAGRLPAQADVDALAGAVVARRHGDGGWSGDDVPVAAGASDLTLTAEITRALAGTASAASLAATFTALEAAAGAATPSLEVAARLAALRHHGRSSAAVTALETELLRDARFVSASATTWSNDPFVNALGLLALGPPGGGFVAPADSDMDRDGLRDVVDADRDGDGVREVAYGGPDAFPNDPGEWTDFDGDGTGDGADSDDDGDGLGDGPEIQAGLDSRDPDTDGDRFADGPDGRVAVARVANAWDLQPNGFVDGEAEPGTDPLDPADHPGKPGDVAPLGLPNGRIDAADAHVARRAQADPALLPGLAGQRRTLALQARDADGDGDFDTADVLSIARRLREAVTNP